MESETNTKRVADVLAESLYQSGVRIAFGMPGGEVITFIDALEKAGITFVLARNETAAAMMAAGTCANAQHPGLLVTTLGPGLANAVNGIADAAQERTPLIIVSGVVDHDIRARYTHQIVDHKALLAPLVKASFEVEAQGAAATLHRAMRLALAHPPGPVHLDLAPNLAATPAPRTGTALAPTQVAQPAFDANDPAFATLRARLAVAKRPLILAGFEAARSSNHGVFAEIAKTHHIPVLTTYKAKGLVDENEPEALGAAGLSPQADKILLELMRASDLVLLVGYDPIEMRPGWLDPVSDPSLLVELGEGADHGMHHAGMRLEGPVAALMEATFDGLQPHDIWQDGEPARAREKLVAAFKGPDAFGPHLVFETLQRMLPDAIITVDSGAHRILFSQRWRAKSPLSVLQSAGWCTMGSAIPLAIGAKSAHPGMTVVAILGDGGLEMTLGELGLLRDQSLPIVIVVLQDESLALIALKQNQSGLAPSGVAMGQTNYARIAEAFGGHGVNVETAHDLREALREAPLRTTFTLIACQIEAKSYVNAF